MRPSTLLRIERLTALIAGFTPGVLQVADIAALLRCSLSSARNYIFELRDAGLIGLAAGSPTNCGIDRMVFCLTADRARIDAFMTVLANPGLFDLTRAKTGARLCTVAPVAAFENHALQPRASAIVNVRRDPLVAALFGAASGGNESRHHSGPPQVAHLYR